MEVNDKIVFKYNGIELQYKVMHLDKYWLSNYVVGANTAIFNLLKIEDRFAFCAKEVGYDFARKTSDFPELESLSDLEKVVNALYQRIIKISTPKFQVGDLVMIVKREGNSSDYPCSYMDEMVQYENQIFIISKINKMSTPIMKSFISRLKYEEPFYYTLKEMDWNWSSAMLHKIGTTKNLITDINAPNITDLIDIGKINICEAPSYIDTHITNGPSLYPEKEEPKYKLNFNVKSLNFLKHD